MRVRRVITGLGLLAVLGSGFGCARALFPVNEARTQYEKYDRMRGQAAPTEEPDVFGNPRPALRARLSPPD